MLNITKLFIIFSTYFISNNYSFELGLWRGYTYTYIRNYNNQFNFTKPIITTYNYSHNFNINFKNNYYYLTNDYFRFKLESYEKNGGVIINANKDTNRISFNNQINFIHNNARSIINVNYYCTNDKKLKLNYISVSRLRSELIKIPNIRIRINTIEELITILKLWSYCKTTNINTKNIYDIVESESESFDFEYLMTNKNHISNIFIDNLVISVPNIIDDNKPFSMLFGCLLSEQCYKQITLNYNFNGYLVFAEFNEYEPFNLNKKINKLLNFTLFSLKLKTLKNKTI
jgi:hypothetical protein